MHSDGLLIDHWDFVMDTNAQFGSCLIAGKNNTDLLLQSDSGDVTYNYSKRFVYLPSYVYHAGPSASVYTAKGFAWIAECSWEDECPYGDFSETNLKGTEHFNQLKFVEPLRSHFRELSEDPEGKRAGSAMQTFAKEARQCGARLESGDAMDEDGSQNTSPS